MLEVAYSYQRASFASRLVLRAAVVAAVLLITLPPVRAQDAISTTRIDTPGTLETSSTPVAKPNHVLGQVMLPPSSMVNAGDTGKKVHTHLRYLQTTTPLEAPPYGGYAYETPASLACVYGLVTAIGGCNPNNTVNTPSGGGQTIAIVDAYDDPEAPADLAYFSDQFGLPFSTSRFGVIYASGYQPAVDSSGGWELEESLDIEYAHAMAPNAMLYLVEADSNSYADLLTAVTVAVNLVQCGSVTTCGSITGKGEVSMSWGGSEFSGETGYDSIFTGTNVVFLASAGDSPGVEYPSASPNVISVGGTAISRSPVGGNYQGEVDWAEGGGGPSAYEAKPSYQSAVNSRTVRVTPDVAADADPNTGVWVYDSFPDNFSFSSVGWWIVGGTSVAAPVWTGIINSADRATATWPVSTSAELTKFYGDLAGSSYSSDFNDITRGWCYYYAGFNAGTGYDMCTGIGSPKSLAGK